MPMIRRLSQKKKKENDAVISMLDVDVLACCNSNRNSNRHVAAKFIEFCQVLKSNYTLKLSAF